MSTPPNHRLRDPFDVPDRSILSSGTQVYLTSSGIPQALHWMRKLGFQEDSIIAETALAKTWMVVNCRYVDVREEGEERAGADGRRAVYRLKSLAIPIKRAWDAEVSADGVVAAVGA